MGRRIEVQWLARNCNASSDRALAQCLSHFSRVPSTPRTAMDLEDLVILMQSEIRIYVLYHCVKLTAALCSLVVHAWKEPLLKYEDATEVGSVMIPISKYIEWSGGLNG